jgi:hypothetical protein
MLGQRKTTEVGMIHLTFETAPSSDGSQSKRYDGWLHAISLPGTSLIEVGYRVDHAQGMRRVYTYIGAAEFGALAKEMMKANPERAIKAFGAAMQDVSFPSEPE